ncbi:hypothetical protein [Macrococcus equi]|uniref:hypothetical protein n=1 Tax=Macrococcus equi TaxID=3395462 RepID=UPI0039BE5F57
MGWLIKVGDKVIWQSEEWEVYSIEEHIIELRRIEDGFGIGTKVDLKFLVSNYFKQLYEQQKQRADRAEKRWEKLKEHFFKEKEQSFGILSWSRNNGMLKLIEQLEEDGE